MAFAHELILALIGSVTAVVVAIIGARVARPRPDSNAGSEKNQQATKVVVLSDSDLRKFGS